MEEAPHQKEGMSANKILQQLALAALIGLAGALAVQGFHLCLSLAERLSVGSDQGLVAAAHALPPLRRLCTPLLGAAAAGLVLWIFVRLRGERTETRSTDYIEGIVAGGGALDAAGSLVKCLASVLVVAGGLAVGREGGMILLSALTASFIAARLAPEKRALFTACGAAAGVAAAYHAPLAGSLFALEMILGSLAPAVLAPTAVAAGVSLGVTLLFGGGRVLYTLAPLPAPELTLYILALPLAVLAALAGSAFLGCMNGTRALFDRLCKGWPPPARLGVGGLIVGVLSLGVPEVWGNGYSVIQRCLAAEPTFGLALLFLAAKILAMLASSAAGAPGGFFTPTLFMGATAGLAAGLVLQASGLAPGGPAAVQTALLAMSAMLAATTHAPGMSAFMVCEVSGAYSMLPLLLLAAAVASIIGKRLHPVSIYGLGGSKGLEPIS